MNAEVEKNGRITVLHLIGSLRVGGAEQQLVSMAPLFDRKRFRIIMCAMQPGGDLMERIEGLDVEYVCLNYRIRSWVQSVSRLVSLLKREEVDVLHTHMYTASRFGRIAGLLAGTPVMIATDHGHDPWKRWQHIVWDRLLLRYTAARIGVARDVADLIVKRENPPPEKVIVVPNGVDPSRFEVSEADGKRVRAELGIAENEILVGAVGRLVEPKALHVMIEAVSKLAETTPNVRLALVGDGPLKDDLVRCASDLGVSERVLFAGVRMDVPAVLAALDVFAMSSNREGLPVVLLEAMAAGKPIVATKVGGIPEVVADHKEALLAAPNNPSELAAAMGELIADRGLREQLGRQARRKVVSQYSVAASVRRLEEVYQDLLGKREAKRGK